MACSHAFSFYSHFSTLATKLTKYMASSLENEIIRSGQALHMGRMGPGDTSEPGLGLRNCFERDLFDRTISLEQTASPIFCSSAYMKIPLTPEVDEKFTFATICRVTRGLSSPRCLFVPACWISGSEVGSCSACGAV